MTIPPLHTDRLLLRAHELGDFESLATMWADPAVTKFIGGQPSTRQQSWMRLIAYNGHWSLKGFGYWAVIEKSTNQYIGGLGYADFKRELPALTEGLPELGWALATEAHGKGYAIEALKAVVTWGDANLSSKKTFCLIHPENLRSISLASKLGYQEFQRTQFMGEPSLLFYRVP